MFLLNMFYEFIYELKRFNINRHYFFYFIKNVCKQFMINYFDLKHLTYNNYDEMRRDYKEKSLVFPPEESDEEYLEYVVHRSEKDEVFFNNTVTSMIRSQGHNSTLLDKIDKEQKQFDGPFTWDGGAKIKKNRKSKKNKKSRKTKKSKKSKKYRKRNVKK